MKYNQIYIYRFYGATTRQGVVFIELGSCLRLAVFLAPMGPLPSTVTSHRDMASTNSSRTRTAQILRERQRALDARCHEVTRLWKAASDNPPPPLPELVAAAGRTPMGPGGAACDVREPPSPLAPLLLLPVVLAVEGLRWP